jgi:hypothetical protein
MTDTITLPRAVIEQVREAFKELDYASEPYVNRTARAALAALDAALAEPDAKPEPVAYFDPQTRKFYWARLTEIDVPTVTVVPPLPLYAAPPEPPAKREPATDKKVAEAYAENTRNLLSRWDHYYEAWRNAERFHGIRKEDK